MPLFGLGVLSACNLKASHGPKPRAVLEEVQGVSYLCSPHSGWRRAGATPGSEAVDGTSPPALVTVVALSFRLDCAKYLNARLAA